MFIGTRMGIPMLLPRAGCADPYWSSVALLVPMDDDFNSVDDDGKTATLVASPVIETTIKKFGAGSGDFTPANAYVSFADHDDWDFGADDFTMEGWIYIPTAELGVYQGVMTSAKNGAQAGAFLRISSGNKLQFLIGRGVGPFTMITGSTSLSGDTWYHIAGVYEASSDKMFIFLDGTSDDPAGLGGTTRGATGPIAPQVAVIVGRTYIDIGSFPFEGYIDDVRWTKGVARYTANFTKPSSAFPACS